ncbi:hypothetical protein [Sphingomonas ginsenosidimutans]|uniref:hypothetical protein n=1 Tax=Sphingomonas ginsenosidimutans TaxID=862134 RepID=UPI001D240BD7|nr:hypothetical protein [Sphingomonas ginsenosidimutans]MBY0301241.1 hypothetical protein [Sphingomonas ginsenosidimutans]
MAQERGYQRQSGTSAPVGLPGASPAAFGAGIGAEVAQIGQTLHQEQLRAYQIERQQQADSEAAAFNATFAKLREEADKASTDARNGAAPGGAGHAQAMQQWYAQRTQGLIDGITDDRVRRSAQMQLEEFGGRLNSAEYQWQEGRRVGKIVTDQTQARDVAANRAYRMSDPKAFAEELSLGRQGIEALSGVPADVLDGLIRDYDEAVSVGFFNGMIERDPKRVAQILDTGKYDAILSPQQMERLRSRAEIGVHALEVRRQRAAQEGVQLQKEDEQRQLQFVTQGGEVSPDRLTDMAAQAYRRGDTSRGDDLTQAAVGMRHAAPFANASAQQLTNAMAEIERDEHWRRDPSKVYAHNWLEKRRADQRAADPAIAAPDWNQPGSVSAYEVKVRADAKVRGAEPQYLSKDMLETMKPRMATLAGRQDLAATLQRLGPAARLSAARQLAPDDDAFQGAVTLASPDARQMVLSGQEVLKAGTTPMAPQKGAVTWRAYAAPALRQLGGDTTNMVRGMADAIAAGLMAREGVQSYSEDVYRRALHIALGGGKNGRGEWTGGLGYWRNGDGRDARIVLPPGWSQADFDRVVARKTGALEGFVNGRKVTAAELRQHFTPVSVETGVYEWEDASGRPLKDARGADWRVRLWRK